MINLKINRYNSLFYAVFCLCFVANAQKQSKKYKETFKVGDEVELNINTSHTNIEFETWDKDVIEVHGVIEIEDATKEAAEAYFKNWNFKATGNSKEVAVSCDTNRSFTFISNGNTIISEDDFDFVFELPEIAEIPEIAPLVMRLPEIPPMPPLPMNGFNSFSFDYEAYKKDGDKYLEKWKKAFNKNFDKDFKKEMEAWKVEVKKYKEEVMKLREEQSKERTQMRKEMVEVREAQRKERDEIRKVAREESRKAREEARKFRVEILEEARENGKSNSNFYFYSSDGNEKNLKVKKTIKIKMPKRTKLKLNVRHGEVKLAENTKNIKATLSHTRLFARIVDGRETLIEASYSPVLVENWKYGELKVNYIRDVAIDRVKSLKLTSNSSDVNIGVLEGEGYINGSFGKLSIDAIAQTFSNLDIGLENTDAVFILPKEAFTLSVNSADSQISYPEYLTMSMKDKYSNQIVKGYYKNANTPKSITLNARYSKILFK
ncbi:hypothetical protein [Ascidiimonas sp. W6]|uniref:hypothetical protein n=1 Tax=Ascidiimonas meishanensis TaxID=3128903 RepID=UPI0030EBD827